MPSCHTAHPPPASLLDKPFVISTDPTLQVAAMNLDEQF
jgi:hypothetical protein